MHDYLLKGCECLCLIKFELSKRSYAMHKRSHLINGQALELSSKSREKILTGDITKKSSRVHLL